MRRTKLAAERRRSRLGDLAQDLAVGLVGDDSREIVDGREAIATSDVELGSIGKEEPVGRVVKDLLFDHAVVHAEGRDAVVLDRARVTPDERLNKEQRLQKADGCRADEARELGAAQRFLQKPS